MDKARVESSQPPASLCSAACAEALAGDGVYKRTLHPAWGYQTVETEPETTDPRAPRPGVRESLASRAELTSEISHRVDGLLLLLLVIIVSFDVLWVTPRVSRMPGKHSTALQHPSSSLFLKHTSLGLFPSFLEDSNTATRKAERS